MRLRGRLKKRTILNSQSNTQNNSLEITQNNNNFSTTTKIGLSFYFLTYNVLKKNWLANSQGFDFYQKFHVVYFLTYIEQKNI